MSDLTACWVQPFYRHSTVKPSCDFGSKPSAANFYRDHFGAWAANSVLGILLSFASSAAVSHDIVYSRICCVFWVAAHMTSSGGSCYCRCWEDKFAVKVDQHLPVTRKVAFVLAFTHKVSGAWWPWPQRRDCFGGSSFSIQDVYAVILSCTSRWSSLGTGWFCFQWTCASMLADVCKEHMWYMCDKTDRIFSPRIVFFLIHIYCYQLSSLLKAAMLNCEPSGSQSTSVKSISSDGWWVWSLSSPPAGPLSCLLVAPLFTGLNRTMATVCTQEMGGAYCLLSVDDAGTSQSLPADQQSDWNHRPAPRPSNNNRVPANRLSHNKRAT